MPNQLLVTSHVYTGNIKEFTYMTLPMLPPDIQSAQKHLIAAPTNRSNNYNKRNRTCTSIIESTPPGCWLP